MPKVLEAESTLTDRYQTTVPEAVRRALNLSKRDKIRYTLRSNGEVVLKRSDDVADPVLEGFLDFLARDLAEHPERLVPVTRSLIERGRSLVHEVDVDIDAPLSPDDE